MAKTCLGGKVMHQVCLPKELHEMVRRVTEYGKADDFIVECATEEIKRRYAEWIAAEHAKHNQPG